MIRARRSDQDELVAKLNELSQNDERILNALQDQGGTQRRVEELLVAVLKVRIRGAAFLVFLTTVKAVVTHRSRWTLEPMGYDSLWVSRNSNKIMNIFYIINSE